MAGPGNAIVVCAAVGAIPQAVLTNPVVNAFVGGTLFVPTAGGAYSKGKPLGADP